MGMQELRLKPSPVSAWLRVITSRRLPTLSMGQTLPVDVLWDSTPRFPLGSKKRRRPWQSDVPGVQVDKTQRFTRLVDLHGWHGEETFCR